MIEKCMLATSAYSNTDLLEKCVTSWCKDIDTAIYFDGYYYEKIFKNLFDNNIISQNVNHVLKPNVPNHIGCAASWNKIIKYGFDVLNKDYVIVVGSDTIIYPGFIEAVCSDLQELKPDFAVAANCSYNCWIMGRKCYDVVGLWDENFFPAYFEDHDYDYRINQLAKLNVKTVGKIGLFEHFGSATIHKNEERHKVHHTTFVGNREYFKKKWGSELHKGTLYTTPYNDPNLTVRDWSIKEPEYSQQRLVWKELEDRLNA